MHTFAIWLSKLLIISSILSPLVSYSQGQETTSNSKGKENKADSLRTKKDNDKIVSYLGRHRAFNRSFANLLGTTGGNNLIGNYASFDPIAGAFAFKGTLPFGNPDSSLSFLSLSLQGDIASDNVAKLFENSKINTNTAIKGEYHFILGIKKIEKEGEREALFNLQETLINKRSDQSRDNEDIELQKNKESLNLVQSEKEVVTLLKVKQDKTIETLKSKIDSLRFKTSGNYKSGPAYVDTLSTYANKLSKALIKYDSLNSQLNKKELLEDSLKFTISKWTYLIRGKANNIAEKQKIKLDSLKDSYLFSRYRLTWVTAIGSIGKKKYYSFDKGLPFNQQIQENDLLTNSYGIAINIYTRNETFRRSILLNIGVLKSLDNDAFLQSTTDISQETTFKNSIGDTTRKVTQKYSAYTDPVTSIKQFSAYANFYYLSGNNSTGLHIFPSYYKVSNNPGYANFGIGFIAAFKNLKKDTPIINLETYILFKDMFNSVAVDSKFYNRNEIGARFTLPFNFF